MPFGKGVSRFVLEGAPGQGKSTVTQFLCQMNRLKLLPSRRSELSSVGPLHASARTRTPFRVDLRDYAAWVSGRHPYAKEGEVVPPEEGQRSLEKLPRYASFMALGRASTQATRLAGFPCPRPQRDSTRRFRRSRGYQHARKSCRRNLHRCGPTGRTRVVVTNYCNLAARGLCQFPRLSRRRLGPFRID